MTSQIVTWSHIETRIGHIRSTHRVRGLTNCFTQMTDVGRFAALASDDAVVFACAEQGFSRLYYHAADAAALSRLLAEFKSLLPLVISYVDKLKNETLCAAFRDAGFVETAHYIRMTSAAFPMSNEAEAPAFATVDETKAVMSVLYSTFDPVTDHLPTQERLYSLIEQQQVIVRRQAGEITGLVAFQVHGRHVNFNYLLNRGRRGDGSSLMQSFFRCMAERDLLSGFLWVNSGNERARRIYTVNGWKADGLNDWFFYRNAS